MRRAVDAIKTGKTFSSAALDEYLTTFSTNLERFRINDAGEEYDDTFITNIDSFLSYRNEFIQVLITVSQYDLSEDNIQILHKFFESFIPYLNPPVTTTPYRDRDFDNFKFIIHELFLYMIAVFIKHERFAQTAHLLSQPFYVHGYVTYSESGLVSFPYIQHHLESLEHRNRRLKLNRLSLIADIIKERCVGVGIELRHLMQADLILYVRSELAGSIIYHERWWPNTLLYSQYSRTPMEIFARASSLQYFNKIKALFGVDDVEQLKLFLDSYRSGDRRAPQWGHRSMHIDMLLNYDHLGERP